MPNNIQTEPKWMVGYDGNAIVLRTAHGAIKLNHNTAKHLGETLIAVSDRTVRLEKEIRL